MSLNATRQAYLDQYREYAKDQMKRYGIPASITMAQAIIESGAGKSKVAIEANNHFGMKAGKDDIKVGNYVLAKDDEPTLSKFKKYDSIEDSYESHSKLLTGKRYTNSFSPTDYRSWAQHLQKKGYATNKGYANLLISFIEQNHLDELDKEVMAELKRDGKTIGVESNPITTKQGKGGQSQTGVTKLISTSTLPISTSPHLAMPVARKFTILVSSDYGVDRGNHKHGGLDIPPANKNVQEKALATEDNGKVVKCANQPNGAGNYVTVEYERKDGSKIQCTYMHLDKFNVKVGDTVQAGQPVGIIGNTGHSTGPHLHFETVLVKPDGTTEKRDPAEYLSQIQAQAGLDVKVQDKTGKDLCAEYQKQIDDTGQQTDVAQNPEIEQSWLEKLTKEGALSQSGDFISMMMEILTALLAMAQQQEMSHAQKMELITKLATEKKADFTEHCPGYDKVEIAIAENGKATLHTIKDGVEKNTVLSRADIQSLGRFANVNFDDTTKSQVINATVTGITIRRNASETYDELDQQQRQGESQTQHR